MKNLWITIIVSMSMFSEAGTPNAYFSPKGGCQTIICHEISMAKSNIVIATYQWSNIAIISEIYKAKKRGVIIEIIVDPGLLLVPISPVLYACTNGISVWVDKKHAIFHDKYIVIDHKKVITGSFNFSQNAENRNAENLVTILDKNLAKEYEADWVTHQIHSVKLPQVVQTNDVTKQNGQ